MSVVILVKFVYALYFGEGERPTLVVTREQDWLGEGCVSDYYEDDEQAVLDACLTDLGVEPIRESESHYSWPYGHDRADLIRRVEASAVCRRHFVRNDSFMRWNETR